MCQVDVRFCELPDNCFIGRPLGVGAVPGDSASWAACHVTTLGSPYRDIEFPEVSEDCSVHDDFSLKVQAQEGVLTRHSLLYNRQKILLDNI